MPLGRHWDKCNGTCNMKKALNTNLLYLPERLPTRLRSVPYVLTCNDAFPVTTYLMKPYPGTGLNFEQRVINYRQEID